jgi:hypothetical protein
MALRNKQEAICEELGNKDGLHSAYTNHGRPAGRPGIAQKETGHL